MKTDRVANLLVVSIALTFVCGAIKLYNTLQKKRTMEWVTHTYEVIQETSGLFTVLLEAQAGQRNFMLTGDSAYLEPYFHNLEIIDQKVEAVLALTADNPSQTTMLTKIIRPVIGVRKTELNHAMATFQTLGRDAAFLEIKNQVAMDSLRSYIHTIRVREEALLKQRHATLQRIYTVNDTINYASLALVGIVSAMALKELLNKDKRNKELTTSLRDANNTLQQKVHERTLELERKSDLATKLNRDLQQNFEELEAFYDALQINNANVEETLAEIRDLYDHAPCGYHSLDNDGTIVRMNATELRWLGYTREEVIGKLTIRDITTVFGQKIYEEYFPLLVSEGAIRNVETELKRRDGSSFPTLLNSTAIYDHNGRYTTNRSVVVDLTERKALEKKLLEANADLMKLNDEKNHLIGIASHDLKSPLNGVLGLVNLLKMDNHNLTADQHEYIDFMEQSCINMQVLINNLLDINRIEQGKNKVTKEPVEISALLKKQYQTFKETAERKNIALLLEDQVPGLGLHTDGNALSRILENLISNAIKFSPAHKVVTISVVRNGTHVCFQVVDQGPGITPEDHVKMFGKFQRLSARPTGGESSSGLGLSIVRELVQALDGRIWVESEINKGARFIVELPLDG